MAKKMLTLCEPTCVVEHEHATVKILLIKALGRLTLRYRFFATGFLLSIVAMAVCVYFIHPGLAGLIVTGYASYFMRVNLVNTEGQRQQIEQSVHQAFAQSQKEGFNPQKGAYL